MKTFKLAIIIMLLATTVFNAVPIAASQPVIRGQPPPDWLVCDINYDGYVGIDDIVEAGEAFGSTPGDPRWNSNADINWDHYVGIDDIVEVAENFGKSVESITIVDSVGREVEVPYPLERIVVLNPSGAEILLALEYKPGDGRELVVGVSGA